MESWSSGIMECWNNGELEGWSGGVMEYRMRDKASFTIAPSIH
jgi:hypothetical protein